MSSQAGQLYVVATPIGNLADLTQRAVDVLSGVELIVAEDTRHTRRLLERYGIAAQLVSYHEHNEEAMMPRLVARLTGGEDLALVSDAGTPLISDPGFVLVRAARAHGVRVVPIPGPNAAIAALSAAGLPTDRFLFLGFPPRSSAKCRDWLAGVAGEPATLILYESGKRAARTLADLAAVLGEGRRAVVARELTKQFETFLDGTLGDLAQRVAEDPEQRLGELVILVDGALPGEAVAAQREQARILAILADVLPLKQAAELTAQITGARRNELYKLGLGLAREREARPGR